MEIICNKDHMIAIALLTQSLSLYVCVYSISFYYSGVNLELRDNHWGLKFYQQLIIQAWYCSDYLSFMEMKSRWSRYGCVMTNTGFSLQLHEVRVVFFLDYLCIPQQQDAAYKPMAPLCYGNITSSDIENVSRSLFLC